MDEKDILKYRMILLTISQLTNQCEATMIQMLGDRKDL